jgi:hypothetical protein
MASSSAHAGASVVSVAVPRHSMRSPPTLPETAQSQLSDPGSRAPSAIGSSTRSRSAPSRAVNRVPSRSSSGGWVSVRTRWPS